MMQDVVPRKWNPRSDRYEQVPDAARRCRIWAAVAAATLGLQAAPLAATSTAVSTCPCPFDLFDVQATKALTFAAAFYSLIREHLI